MLPLILFILMVCIIVVLLEWRERQRNKQKNTPVSKPAENGTKNSMSDKQEGADPNCCGMHLVCEKTPPLADHIVYYEDEELDQLKDIPASEFTEQQVGMIEEVYRTLNEDDIIGWTQSLEQRHIALPQHIYDEALIIVKEKRSKK